MTTYKFKIKGFVCGACAKLAKMKIEEINGVENACADITGETEIIANRKISVDELDKVFKGSNYKIIEG